MLWSCIQDLCEDPVIIRKVIVPNCQLRLLESFFGKADDVVPDETRIGSLTMFDSIHRVGF